MDEQLKRRLVGATVLVALAIIFLPMLLEHQPDSLKPRPMNPLPEEPPRRFDATLLQDTPPQAASGAAGEKSGAAPNAAQQPVAAVPAKASAPDEAAGQASKKPVPARKPAPARKSAPATPSGWVVRVASLSSRENAVKLVKKLRKAGLDTMDPRPVTVNGKRYYRVQVGPEVSKKNAERHLKLIEKITGSKGQVVRYP